VSVATAFPERSSTAHTTHVEGLIVTRPECGGTPDPENVITCVVVPLPETPVMV